MTSSKLKHDESDAKRERSRLAAVQGEQLRVMCPLPDLPPRCIVRRLLSPLRFALNDYPPAIHRPVDIRQRYPNTREVVEHGALWFADSPSADGSGIIAKSIAQSGEVVTVTHVLVRHWQP